MTVGKKFSRLAFAASMTLAPSMAGAEQIHAYFGPPEDGGASTNLTYSPCTGEEVSECVSYQLQCAAGEWPVLRFSIVTGPVENVAKAMIFGTEGQPTGTLKLAGGKTAQLRFATVHLDSNEMDGGWMLSTGLLDPTPFLKALSAKSAEGAALVLGPETFVLAPEKGDGGKLVQFGEACEKML